MHSDQATAQEGWMAPGRPVTHVPVSGLPSSLLRDGQLLVFFNLFLGLNLD